MRAKKKQHFLSEAYLTGFCDGGKSGKLWVYDRQRQHFRNQRPHEVAAENYFYSLPEASGQRNSDVEETLMDIESKAMPCIRKLRAQEKLAPEERWRVSLFLAVLTTRVPEFRLSVQKVFRSVADLIEDFATAANDAPPFFYEMPSKDVAWTSVEQVRAVASDDGLMQKNFLTLMLATAEGFARLLFEGHWEILKAPPGSSFVTSDNPIVKIPPPRQGPYGVGLLSPTVLKLIPIALDTALRIFGVGSGYDTAVLETDDVRDCNLLIAGLSSTSLVIAREKAILEDLFSDARLADRPEQGLMIAVSPVPRRDDD